jgi:hypothetical protein
MLAYEMEILVEAIFGYFGHGARFTNRADEHRTLRWIVSALHGAALFTALPSALILYFKRPETRALFFR